MWVRVILEIIALCTVVEKEKKKYRYYYYYLFFCLAIKNAFLTRIHYRS